MKRFLIFFFSSIILNLSAQELNCTVQVLTPSLQGDKSIFDILEKSIFEFMNNRRWTTDNYKNDERIECSIIINITERNNDAFNATIQVQSRRPVYNTSYNSILFNYLDQEFQFSYVQSQPLYFSETSYQSNLTSVLAFYANMILAYDADTFSLLGGTPYYQKANNILNNAQADGSTHGWKSFESQRNRYWMVSNMIDPVYAPIRECNYKYHRLGLDEMSQDKEKGRKVILENMTTLLKRAYQDRPTSFSLQLYFNAKRDEIINIFSGAASDEKIKILELLNEVDPSNSNKYQKIMTSN